MQYRPGSGARRMLTPDQYSLYRLIWNRFVASQMTPGDLRRDDGRHHGRATTCSAPRARCRSSPAGWRSTARAPERGERAHRAAERRTDGASGGRRRAAACCPPLAEGDALELQGAQARAEVHPAAAALQRGDAGQGARRERHRPAEHLRLDHQRAAGARLRQQARRPLQADAARRRSGRASCCSRRFDDIIDVEYTRSLEEDLDKIEQGKTDYADTLGEFYKKFKKDLKRAGKEMPNFKEGQPTGDHVRQVRQGDGRSRSASSASSSPAAAIPECDNTQRARDRPSAATEGARRERARTAASRWSSSAAASASSSPAPAIRSARRRARSSRPSRAVDGGQARPDPRREVPELRQEPGRSSRAGSASSPPAPATRRASTSSRSRRASSAPRTAATSSSASRAAARCSTAASNYPEVRLHAVEPAARPNRVRSAAAPFLTEKITKRHGRQLVCATTKSCDYVRIRRAADRS